MANDQSFRYRTILEVAVISLVIYFLVGTPGLFLSSTETDSDGSQQSQNQDIPLSKSKTKSLVHADPDLHCGAHLFKGVHILSTGPLVIVIDGFLSESEADHMVAISCVYSTAFVVECV